MDIPPGHYTLGPGDATLTVRTRKAGAASKAGHNLRIEVTSWRATLDVAEDPAATQMALTADARSLRVREGTGGMQALDDDDMENIEQTIDDEVLKGTPIVFRSTSVRRDGDRYDVSGELELWGKRRPLGFSLDVAGGQVTGSARVKQTDWGMKPYSALFGTLKVADEIEVEIRAKPGG